MMITPITRITMPVVVISALLDVSGCRWRTTVKRPARRFVLLRKAQDGRRDLCESVRHARAIGCRDISPSRLRRVERTGRRIVGDPAQQPVVDAAITEISDREDLDSHVLNVSGPVRQVEIRAD